MKSYYWIKLYQEILHDPKMGKLTDRLWRRVIECFLMAGEQDEDGYLPDISDMAWLLRCDADELEQELGELSRCEILEKIDGRWYVTNYEERQRAFTDAEKQRNYRDRKKKEQYYGGNDGNNQEHNHNVTMSVTTGKTEKRREDIDKDNTNGADAPGDEPQPYNFKEWHNLIENAKNKPAALIYMFESLYPGREKPSFGFIGKVARDIPGGHGRLAELMWQHSTKPPTGDILQYLLAVARNQKARGDNGQNRPARNNPDGKTLGQILTERTMAKLKDAELPDMPG